MAKILVTGGVGFIGSHLTTALVAAGHEVRVLDNLSSGSRENLAHLEDQYEWMEGDIRTREDCRRACADIDHVFHQAAIPSVPKSVDRPEESHDANVNGTFNMLRASVEEGVGRFIYAASSSAYGDTPVSPMHEDLKPEPLSPYAVQKHLGECYARAFYECYELESISLRYFNVFGARQDPASDYAAAIPAFAGAILRGEKPTVFGDGEQTRDFTHVDNVVAANLLALKAKKVCGQVVNIACGQAISINEVINAINRLLHTDIVPEHASPRQGDVRHSCAELSRAQDLLGYVPGVDFEDGLRRTIEYYRSLPG